VWELFARVIARTGPLPTLIEWDNAVPAFAVLLAEAGAADALLAVAAPARDGAGAEAATTPAAGGGRHAAAG